MPKKATGRRIYVGLEPALKEATQKHLISNNRSLTDRTKKSVEQIVTRIVDAMKKQSPVFRRLYKARFGGGSIYEGLKIGSADEFDIDILLKMPEEVKPVLVEDNVAGFAPLKLTNFKILEKNDPEMYKIMKDFVDNEGFLLPKAMKSSFMQSIFDKTMNQQFPNGIVRVGSRKYEVVRVQHCGPAFTLTLDGPDLDHVAVDLVTSIVLDKRFWPDGQNRQNPYSSSKLQEFFLSPTSPKQEHLHRNRFWRLSFHIQEREIIFNRFWMKPAIRVHKRLRDHFGHSIRSYAIKTVFLWELAKDNPNLDGFTPEFWCNSPLSYIVVHMLEKYLKCLNEGCIPDFWNPELNLLCHLSQAQLSQYRQDVGAMVQKIKKTPEAHVLLNYLI